MHKNKQIYSEAEIFEEILKAFMEQKTETAMQAVEYALSHATDVNAIHEYTQKLENCHKKTPSPSESKKTSEEISVFSFELRKRIEKFCEAVKKDDTKLGDIKKALDKNIKESTSKLKLDVQKIDFSLLFSGVVAGFLFVYFILKFF